MLSRRSGPRVVAAAFAVAAAAACASTRLDVGAVEEQVATTFGDEGGRDVSSVDCPEDVVVTAGATFECGVSFADAGSAKVEVRMTDNRGAVEWHVVG